MLLPNFQLRGSSSLTCYFAPHFSVSSSSLPTLTRHPSQLFNPLTAFYRTIGAGKFVFSTDGIQVSVHEASLKCD